MVQSIRLAVELDEAFPYFRGGLPPRVLERRESDLACGEDVVAVETILLKPGIRELDEPESASRLLRQGDSNGIVTHETKILKEQSKLYRGVVFEADCLERL